ncbi:AraC family transcriptional regulator [Hymenobacter sp. GOD-10R]|uniref:helix-turn-helix transcriptional regulator n=1 Tax=Hymenobacter sp. GOD-10R TaxID=3093922 RepID=UPI002D79671F|nr:AraC family transcriptional regulator [Hymenobacter sp. GOD-10R]WRQ30826.1 AraC family transcriptional regulator [Hymenobacter sp. GOD-10R]
MNYQYNSEMYGQPAAETSAHYAWPGLRVERYQLEAMVLPAHYHAQHLLLLHQGKQPVRSRRGSGRRLEEGVFRAGDAGLYPAGEYESIGWDGPADLIHLHLDAQVLEERARQEVDARRFGLREQFQFADGFLNQLGQQLLLTAKAEYPLGKFYVESLVTTLSYHLITHHATYEHSSGPTGARLTTAVLARIEAYLEDAPEQVVSLATLAGLANLSVFHFARRFKLTTGSTPYQYVLAWKMKRAQQLLRAGELPIALISDSLGFASPTHFSAAFKRALGCTPRTFQRR